jgi:hypothetical protein
VQIQNPFIFIFFLRDVKLFNESKYGSRKRNSAVPRHWYWYRYWYRIHISETLSYIKLSVAEMDGEPQIAEHPYEDGGPPPHVELGR